MRLDSTRRSRRRFVRNIGLVTVFGLAGCSEGGDGPSGTDTDDGEGDGNAEFVDRWLNTQEDAPPADLQWNEYNPTNYGLQMSLALFDPLANYDPANDEFVPYVLDDWSIEEEAVTLKFSEDFTWHNGEPVTAKDLVTQLRLGKFFDYPVWDYITSVEEVDEFTVELSLDGPMNPEVVKPTVLGTRLKQAHSVYNEKLSELQDASSDDERDQVLQELTEWKLKEPVGTGPFAFAEAGQGVGKLERFEDHPVADKINFKGIQYKNITSAQARMTALETGEVDFDATIAVPPEVKEGFPDHLLEILRPAYAGGGILFDHDHDVLGERSVRQAFAHIVDRKLVASNAGEDLKVPVDIISGVAGIPFDYPQEALGETLDGFTTYETDADKASALLEEAGLQQDGDTWVKSDGNEFSPSLKVPASYPDWVTAGQTIVGQLNNFGIEADFESVEGTTFFDKVKTEGNYEMAMDRWGGYEPYPYASFRKLYASTVSKEAFNFPREVSVPMPIGDASGSEETVSVEEKVLELANIPDQDEANTIISELAWVTNQTLPTLPVMETMGHSWLTTDDWDTPDADDPVLAARYPPYWPIRLGEFQAKPN